MVRTADPTCLPNPIHGTCENRAKRRCAPLVPLARHFSDQCPKMGDEHNTRNPMSSMRSFGLFLTRAAERAKS